jgi:hypothetical protein
MELADRALPENIRPRLAFRPVADRLRHRKGIEADDLVQVAFTGLRGERLAGRRLGGHAGGF